MTPAAPLPHFRSSRRAALGLFLLLIGASSASAQGTPRRPTPRPAPSRQVTLFGIVATPGGDSIDPRLTKIEPQLRRLFPNHSFKLLGVESKRLTAGRGMTCELGDTGFVAGTELLQVLDPDGNVQFKFALDLNGQTEFTTIVKSPPNQLFFCDKMLTDGSRLLIGLGGR